MSNFQLTIGAFFCLFAMNFGNALLAQINADSLRGIWNNEHSPDSLRFQAIDDYCYANTFVYPDSVLSIVPFHAQLAREKGNQEEAAKALNNQAIAYIVLGQADSALSVFHVALDLVKNAQDTLGMTRQYVNIGSTHRNQRNFLEAVKYYSQGLHFSQQQGYLSYEADILNNLGLVYFDIKEYDLADDYLNQALERYEELGTLEKTGNIWLNLASVQFERGDNEGAIMKGRKALPILFTNNHILSVGDCYHLFALIYQQRGIKDSSFYYVNKSLQINQEIGNEEKTLSDQLLLANLMRGTDLANATKKGEEALMLLKNLSNNSLRASSYKLLYECYREQGHLQEALEMNELYLTYSDSVRKEENNIAVVRNAIQSDFEAKLFSSQLENEKAQAELKLKQVRRTYTILFIGLLIIAGLVFYSRHRLRVQRAHQQQLLEEINRLKQAGKVPIPVDAPKFELDRTKIEEGIGKTINETDWQVLNVLLNDPVTSNKDIADQVFKSVDGVGSSLRRMYVAFDIKESKYKKISLITKAIKLSNG